jgi:predicted dienelactone hydrolase
VKDKELYKCGYREGLAHDLKRLNWKGTAARPLSWCAWYPAIETAVEEEKFVGPPECALFTQGTMAENADMSVKHLQWPVVLLSHGTGGTAQSIGWIGRALAVRGFIALAINHHGNTSIEPYCAEGFLCWWERASDLSAILDLASTVAELKGRLDMTNVFAVGGAITSLSQFEAWTQLHKQFSRGPKEFPNLADEFGRFTKNSDQFRASVARHGENYSNPFIRAIVAIAPPPPIRSFKPENIADMLVPVKIIFGGSDSEAPYQDCALWLQTQNSRFHLTSVGNHVGHYTFLCQATKFGIEVEPGLCADAKGVIRQLVHQKTIDEIVNFFVPQLRN